MDLLEKICSPAIQQKYVDKMRLQIIGALREKGYNESTQPRSPALEEILSSTISSSLGLSQSCCDLLETLVNERLVESKYASQQLHAALACALDLPDSLSRVHISPALSVLPRVQPVTSFAHPLILLLNEYPMVWPYVLSLLEVWLKKGSELQCTKMSMGRIPTEAEMLPVRRSPQPEEIQFVILYIMLRPEWPLEHSLLRMRVNQLLLGDLSRWRSLVSFYTRWLPASVSSVHLLQLGQLLSDNCSSIGGLTALVTVLAFLRHASPKEDADLSFVIHTAIQIACNLKDDDRESSHPCVVLLLGCLLTTCGRLYGPLLLELARILFNKQLLPGAHLLALSLCHSAIAGHPTARKIITEIKKEGYESAKDLHAEFVYPKALPQLRSVPNDLLPALAIPDDPKQAEILFRSQRIPSTLQGLVIAGKIVSCPGPQLSSWIRIITDLCSDDSENSCLAFFAIQMRLEAEMSTKNVFLLLESLPHIATNKMSAVLVRNMLVSMCNGVSAAASPVSLQSLALVLLSRLYVSHSALIFPTLLRLLNSNSGSDDFQPSLAFAVAQAQAVKTVIQNSPWLHGPDTLPCLCRLLALRSSEMTCIFPPCLDGIRVLIECHVVTLSSFLKKYSECFTRDLRPQVRAAFCALIGHLPLSDTSEMELLKYQKQLWTLFFNEDEHNVVRASCLDALACFPDLTVAGLPEKEGYKVQLSPEGKPITLEESVPASLFTVGRVSFICNHSNSSCLQKAFSNFISARIRHDVRRLPRSAITHHQGHRSSQSTRQARPLTSSLAQIPRLQQSFFHQNNKDIHAQAAVGLLLTYNPPMKTDQSGAAANKSAAVQHSNSFVSMFRSLIEAVPIFDANDWFMSLACLPQWHLLVERAFVSLTNGRKAECGDNEQSKLFASLWARDQLITIAAEVGSGNGVIAICSLVTVVHEFDKTLKLKERLQMDSQHQYNIPDSTGDKYLSHAEWPLRALRSLLRLVQKRPIDDSYFAHLLAKFTRTASSTEKAIGAVLFSVHQMLPLLQSQGLLHDALKCFTIKAQHEEFLVAVGAGLMIQKLVFRGIIDVAEDIRKICEDIAQKFIAWTFDSDNSTVRSPSYLIGTTLAMSGLCSVRMLQAVAQPFCARIIGLLRTSSSTTPRESSVPSDTHQTATVSSSSSSQWESSENDADTFDEITALCCAVMAINGRQFVLKNDGIQDRYGSSGNVGEQNSLRDLAEWLTQRRAQMPTNTGVAIALGLILHSMAECDPTTASTSSSQQEQQQRQDQVTEAQGSVPGMQVVFAESHRLVEALLTKVWLPVVANAHESVAHKTTAVKGIASLTGALDHLIVQRTMIPDRNSWCGSSVLTRDVTSTLLDAMIRDVNATSQSVADTATLKAHHIWTLGLFHRTLTRTFSSEPATSYPSFLNLGSTDNTSSVLTEVVKAAAKDSRVFSMLVDSLGQSFDSPLPCFAWVQLQRHLYNREAQGAHVQRALVILAIENVKMTPSVLPLLEVIISSAVLDALEDASKDFLLDRLLIIVEVCDTTKVGPFLSLYKDRRLNSEDVRTAEEAWKLLASYIEDSSANSSSVYLILEMACYALPSTRARYYVARCLINFREVTLRDLVLRSLITPEKLSLRRALELRMALAGVIEMADIENPFTIIDAMGDSEFTEFLTECTSVNCPASVAENSVRWLLEILPQGSVSCHSAALLSLLASMMTEPCEWMDRITDTSRIEKQLLLLLPYRVDQMMKSKLWAPEAIKHVLQWLISVLENTSPSTHTYPVLHDTLMALRGKQEYRNNRNIWTRAVKLSSPTSI